MNDCGKGGSSLSEYIFFPFGIYIKDFYAFFHLRKLPAGRLVMRVVIVKHRLSAIGELNTIIFFAEILITKR